MAKLIKNVYVYGPDGQMQWVRPGDDIPSWAFPILAKNPALWDEPPVEQKVAKENAPKLPEPEPTPAKSTKTKTTTATTTKRATRKAEPKES